MFVIVFENKFVFLNLCAILLRRMIIMTKEARRLRLISRIQVLSERQKDNGRIVNKLKRRLANLDK